MPYVLAAILTLAPSLPQATARDYARIIERESQRYHVDPLLVVTIIHVESSWNTRARSVTHDWGLMQVHVSETSNPRLLGREKVLFDPEVGIRFGVRTLAMWWKYHRRACGKRPKHLTWGHYQWGHRVRTHEWSYKVRDVYLALQEKTRRPRHGPNRFPRESQLAFLEGHR